MFVAPRALRRRTPTAAADEIDFPAEGRFAVGGEIPGFRPYDELKAGQPTTLPADRTTGKVMNYTSGTTGRPKGVRRPLPGIDPEDRRSRFGGMLLDVRPPAVRRQRRTSCGSPLYHTAVLVFAGGVAAHRPHRRGDGQVDAGADALPDRQATGSRTRTWCRRSSTACWRCPTTCKAKYDVSSLRHMVHAAAPCPLDVKRRMLEWWGPVIDEYYAASEGGGTLVYAEEWLEHPGTVGRAWPGSEIGILDDDGNELPARRDRHRLHAHGDRRLRVLQGQGEDATRAGRGDFFTVGDVGYLDEDGWLFLCDRKIDMIISGGANIYPAEIESELLTHPKVADVAVFGIPHDDWGEEVKAVVEPVDGVDGGPALAAEILAWCGDTLAKFKTPKTIDFIDEMPRDPNGKLYKRKLRDPYWEGRERAI